MQPRLVTTKNFSLAPELLLRMHNLMVRSRALEERLIKMYKQNDGFFRVLPIDLNPITLVGELVPVPSASTK